MATFQPGAPRLQSVSSVNVDVGQSLSGCCVHASGEFGLRRVPASKTACVMQWEWPTQYCWMNSIAPLAAHASKQSCSSEHGCGLSSSK